MIPPTYKPKKKFMQLAIAEAKRARDRGDYCASPQSKSHQKKDRFANRVARMDANLAVRALRHCWG